MTPLKLIAASMRQDLDSLKLKHPDLQANRRYYQELRAKAAALTAAASTDADALEGFLSIMKEVDGLLSAPSIAFPGQSAC